MKRVGVIGGGISGLVAAWHLVTHAGDVEGLEVTVYEASDRVGGKLRQERIAGHQVDVGAESALWRRPEVVDLLAELDVDAVHPQRFPAMLWSRGSLENLPAGTLMGIPSDPESAAGLLTDDEVARAADERPIHLDGDDITVGDAVEQALGAAIVDRMVEPLLGGVYAGNARYLSAKACVPALYSALRQGVPLTDAAAGASSAVSSKDTRQVFGAPDGGMGSLPAKLKTALESRGVRIVTDARVTEIRRSLGHRGSWHLEVEVGGLAEPVEAEAVVLAVPAFVAGPLLADLAPVASDVLAQVEHASVALVTYAFPSDLTARLPEGTGFLVPPVDQRTIKASTFSSVKWPWLAQAAPEATYVRVSVGRFGEEGILAESDDTLAQRGLADLEAALGRPLPQPLETHVQRWTDALPQFGLGHTERMAQASDAVAGLPGLALAGAVYNGVGIPACIATARDAAEGVLADLTSSAASSGATPPAAPSTTSPTTT